MMNVDKGPKLEMFKFKHCKGKIGYRYLIPNPPFPFLKYYLLCMFFSSFSRKFWTPLDFDPCIIICILCCTLVQGDCFELYIFSSIFYDFAVLLVHQIISQLGTYQRFVKRQKFFSFLFIIKRVGECNSSRMYIV